MHSEWSHQPMNLGHLLATVPANAPEKEDKVVKKTRIAPRRPEEEKPENV